MKLLTVCLALVLATGSGWAAAQQTPSPQITAETVPESDLAYPFRLFPTKHIWTFILLDTTNGQAWQVEYTLNGPGYKFPINLRSFLPEGQKPKNGRFTLYPTHNMYNFMLLDREEATVWQLQWSLKPENRGIINTIK